jgi:hypothetical protein
MKKTFLTIMTAIFMATLAIAQSAEFKRGGDRKLDGFNALKKMDDISVIQASVYFQNKTQRGIHVTERNALGGALGGFAGSKSGGNAASATLTAYLVFSDGEPSDAEYQKVADEFYDYLNNQLNKSGIKAVSWDQYAGSKYYSGLKDENENDKESEEMTKKDNAWKIYTAHGGPRPIRYNPMNHRYNVPAVGGTVKMSNYGKEVNTGTLMALNVVVDFADIFLEGEASSGTEKRTYSTLDWKKSTIRYNLTPHIRVTSRHNGGNQAFVFPVASKAFDEVYNTNDIRAAQRMNAQVDQDPSKIQKRTFLANLPSTAQKHDIDPFVVETTKAEYFAQVSNALQQYADELVKAFVAAKK